jgi:hypothetical protein
LLPSIAFKTGIASALVPGVLGVRAAITIVGGWVWPAGVFGPGLMAWQLSLSGRERARIPIAVGSAWRPVRPVVPLGWRRRFAGADTWLVTGFLPELRPGPCFGGRSSPSVISARLCCAIGGRSAAVRPTGIAGLARVAGLGLGGFARSYGRAGSHVAGEFAAGAGLCRLAVGNPGFVGPGRGGALDALVVAFGPFVGGAAGAFDAHRHAFGSVGLS